MQHRDEPPQVADQNGIIYPEFHPQRLPNLGRNVRIGREFSEGIPRGQGEQDKKNEADAEQAGKSDDETPEEVVSHRCPYIDLRLSSLASCGSVTSPDTSSPIARGRCPSH